MARYIDADKVEGIIDCASDLQEAKSCICQLESEDVVERTEYDRLKRLSKGWLEEKKDLHSKIDKAIEEIESEEVEVDFMNERQSGFNSGLFKALEIIKGNLGE